MYKKDNDPWVRTFSVSNPIRHKKGYTLYKVVSKVFPKNSIESVTQVTVWKRYNDFKKFHKALHAVHQGLYLPGVFPIFAKARFFGRFDDEVVEERRRCALELLEFCSKHSPLFTSQVFVKFFEIGHIVDIPEEPEEICNEPVLLPVTTNAQPLSSDDSDQNGDQETSESVAPLGGIWQHHQDCDVISISSLNNTEGEDEEEDDRTTFTDEDPPVTKTTVDLSEFDPVLTSESGKSEDICNDWLLSAFQSCGVKSDKLDDECAITYPKPFENHIFEDRIKVEEPTSVLEEVSGLANAQKLDFSVVDEFDPLYANDFKEGVDSATLDALNDVDTAPPYILSAAKCISAAHQAEVCLNYFDAFAFYKTAVDVLLRGVQEEKNKKQHEAVRHKILVYLKRAEELYENYISQEKEYEDSRNKEPPVAPEIVHEKRNELSLRHPMSDLEKYRVIGILSRVILVLNTFTNTTCIVKVLRKSPCPHVQDAAPSIAPQGIPFVVQLYEVYETVDAIFLILEYASGGRLWDYISSYLQRSPLNATDCDTKFTKPETTDNSINVYSGKKLHHDIGEKELLDTVSSIAKISNPLVHLSEDEELKGAADYPPSYLSLFQNYMIATEKRNTLSLAKCNVRLSGLTEIDDVNLIGLSEDNNNSVNPSCEKVHKLQDILNCKLQSYSKSNEDTESQKVQNECIGNSVRDRGNVPSHLDASDVKLANDITLDGNCDITLSNNDSHNDNDSHDDNDIHNDNGSHKDNVQTHVVVTESCRTVGANSGEDFPGQGYERGRFCVKKNQDILNLSQDVSHSSKGFCLSEAFKQMDTAISLAAVKPLHLPESLVVLWAAEIVTALSALHKLGIIWRDLNPENILLGSEGHILLTYKSCWNSVHHVLNQNAVRDLYSAPEVNSVFPVTKACDWWSLGAILFELITGQKLVSCQPVGITSHTILSLPKEVSPESADLLRKLLVYNASERLGSGLQGVEDIKSHPYFCAIEWKSLNSS